MHSKRHIEWEIRRAQESVEFWARIEAERRKGKFGDVTFPPNKLTHKYIKQAKEHRKQAEADLKYWKDMLANH